MLKDTCVSLSQLNESCVSLYFACTLTSPVIAIAKAKYHSQNLSHLCKYTEWLLEQFTYMHS